MKAIILAAGKGARLSEISGDLPKCLVTVGGLTLIEHQIRALRSSGIDEIIVVVGYGAEQVRGVCGGDITYIENTRYSQTNSLFSLWLSRDRLSDGFVVLNADVLFHPQLLKDLLTARYEDALLVAYCDETMPALGEEEMKVKVRGGRVADISKTMNPRKADGENVGIVKFGSEGAAILVHKLDAVIAGGAHRDWAPRAFREFAFERPLYAISTRGLPWIEIDFPDDYHRAVNEVMPLITIEDELGEIRELAASVCGEK
jgi:L-glutamine-phosphate cytidylyltransferase